MAAYTKSRLFAWLVQEYEPIFHDYSADHVITAFPGRVRGMRISRSQGVKSWSEVFNDDFFRCEMGGFLGTESRH
jgi:hypothetical protein